MKDKISILLLAGPALIGMGSAPAEIPNALSHALVGSPREYVVEKGDFLTTIAARFGESAMAIAQANGIDYEAPIVPGKVLKIDNLHVVPETLENGIVINLPQRLLFFFRDAALLAAYPVGLGRPTLPTPHGDFSVAMFSRNPNWIVPISIQEEMRREGEAVRTEVPPGPDNPLGKYWIGLSRPGYGIHGTVSPSSVYQFRSHGCIRLQPEDIKELFPQVRLGDPIKIIYASVLVALLNDGRIYLEVNPDVYDKGVNALRVLTELVQANHLTHRIDWKKAAQVVRKQEGIARQINLEANRH